MKDKNNWTRIIFLSFFAIFGVFILLHKPAFFDPVKNTVHLTDQKTEILSDGTQQLSYSFQAKNKKTRYIKLQLTTEQSIKELKIELRDSSNHLLASKNFKNQKTDCFIWNIEQKLQETRQYYINIVLSETATLNINNVKLKYHTFHTGTYYGLLLLSGSMILLLIFDWIRKKDYYPKKQEKIRISSISLLLLNGLFSFFILEFVFENIELWNIKFYYILHNWVFCSLVYIILLVFFNSFKLSAVTGNIFFLIWALANRFVMLFKGQPIQPIDLLNISTARSVAREYTYTLRWEMMTAILLTAALIFLIIRTPDQHLLLLKGKKRFFYCCFPLLGCLLFAAEYTFIIKTDYISDMNMKVHLWRNEDTYHQYGIPMGFLATGKNMQVEKPENYSSPQIEQLTKPYTIEAKRQKDSAQRPHIIAIMNESFADLSYIKPDLKTNVPYLSFYHSLKENTVKGTLLVSPFGGWTANSEYEFLFGHSMELLGASIPYSQYLSSSHDTLASNLKLLGYNTTAYHPHKPNNWRRASVYPNLGFDRFITRDDLNGLQKIRNYVSDEFNYQELYHIMETTTEGERNFIFNVTLQNHGGYTYSEKDFTSDVHIEGENFPEADQYLTLIKKSDEALKELIEYFSNYKEPVIIVFFGDHYPNLSSEFYNWLYGKPERQLTLEEIQKKYTVPFFIWANYDIQEQENVQISTNYLSTKLMEVAGLPKTPYQLYLTEFQKKIPAINVNGYMDQNGIFHHLDEQNEYTPLLEQYDLLQYNELFDTKNKVTEFFQIFTHN